MSMVSRGGLPHGSPGPLTELERFQFSSAGFLVVEDALTLEETAASLAASERVHNNIEIIRQHTVPAPATLPRAVENVWRQLGCTYEFEPALEELLDHPSVFQKIAPLLGEHFIVHSTWDTMVPSGTEGGGFHQDASGPSLFRRLANPAPLVQVRVAFVLTDLSKENCGNLVVIPGSHHAELPLPNDTPPPSSAIQLRAKAGSAILFHQGLWHSGGPNAQSSHRYMFHTVYAPSWLRPTERLSNSEEFLQRTTPQRRQLLANFGSVNEYLMMPSVLEAPKAVHGSARL